MPLSCEIVFGTRQDVHRRELRRFYFYPYRQKDILILTRRQFGHGNPNPLYNDRIVGRYGVPMVFFMGTTLEHWKYRFCLGASDLCWLQKDKGR